LGILRGRGLRASKPFYTNQIDAGHSFDIARYCFHVRCAK
jgi:hypothetical protein